MNVQTFGGWERSPSHARAHDLWHARSDPRPKGGARVGYARATARAREMAGKGKMGGLGGSCTRARKEGYLQKRGAERHPSRRMSITWYLCAISERERRDRREKTLTLAVLERTIEARAVRDDLGARGGP